VVDAIAQCVSRSAALIMCVNAVNMMATSAGDAAAELDVVCGLLLRDIDLR
jgi:hypothetical protein